MWAGNNVTRPFRLAGAAALAPFMDRLMEKLQVGCRFCGSGSSGNHHSRRGTLQQLSSSHEALLLPTPLPSSCKFVGLFPCAPHPQARLKLRSKAAAFAIMAGTVAIVCFSILGTLFFSRWVRG